jgi:AAHS family 4-hydroxybenzoate transporter-like MFS transporter
MSGIVWFSIFTFASIFANSVTNLLYLRVLACTGLGGTVPISIVLVNEYAPKRSRGKWVALMFMGFSFGQSVAGLLSAWLVPAFGWRSIFIFGGIVPLILCTVLYYKLPESLRFLVIKNKNREEIVSLVSQLQPGIVVGPDTQFIIEEEKKTVKLSPKLLFVGALIIVTPLIWLVYIINSSTVYFLNSWLPQLQTASGFSLREASITTSIFHLGGMLCTIVVGWLFDKRGMLALSIFPLLGCLIMATLGYPKSVLVTSISLFFAGFFVIGTQSILTITTPTFYPTSIRASASGLAMSIAKIGSILGPIIGGILMSAKLSLKELYFINGGVLAISMSIIFTLGLIAQRHCHKVNDSVSDSINTAA